TTRRPRTSARTASEAVETIVLGVLLAHSGVGKVVGRREVERELTRRRLGGVGGVDQVRGDAEGPVAPDRARRRGLGVGRAGEETYDRDRGTALERECHHRTGGDVLDQR